MPQLATRGSTVRRRLLVLEDVDKEVRRACQGGAQGPLWAAAHSIELVRCGCTYTLEFHAMYESSVARVCTSTTQRATSSLFGRAMPFVRTLATLSRRWRCKHCLCGSVRSLELAQPHLGLRGSIHMTQGLWTIAPCKQFAGLHRTGNVYVGIGECGPNGHLKRFRTRPKIFLFDNIEIYS